MTPCHYYYCVMCVHDKPWVGDYNAGDLIGECPECHSSVGIFMVEAEFPKPGTPYRAVVDALIAAGDIDRLSSRRERP